MVELTEAVWDHYDKKSNIGLKYNDNEIIIRMNLFYESECLNIETVRKRRRSIGVTRLNHNRTEEIGPLLNIPQIHEIMHSGRMR